MEPCEYCNEIGHDRKACASAEQGVAALITKAALLAEGQAALGRLLHIPGETLSRAKKRGTLSAMHRAAIVGYLDHRLHGAPMPKPVTAHVGRPESPDVEAVWINAPKDLLDAFKARRRAYVRRKVTAQMTSQALSAALLSFAAKYTVRPLPPPAISAESDGGLRARVDPTALAAFDRVIGGVGRRGGYFPIAIAEWLAREPEPGV